MIENIRLSLRGILSHKLRSFLTMLGIIIGIAAIIAIVSIIKGTNEQIQKNLIGSGDNLVTVELQQSGYAYDMSSGIPAGINPVSDEIMQQLKAVDHVESIAKYNYRNDYDGIYHLNTSLSGGYVYGIDENYFATADKIIEEGRGITANDNAKYNHAVVIDENAEQSLFEGEDALGKTIEIKGVPFDVVGIVRDRVEFEPVINSMDDYYTYNQDRYGSIYVPMSVWPAIYQYDEPENIILKGQSTNDLTQIGRDAAAILNSGISSSDSSIQYAAKDLMEQAKQIQQLSSSTNQMLIWIAGISLLVGGIGVMNIMLVSVTERTSEIGLKKAIGAKKKDIMMQFLTEAVVLTSIGGLLGVILGIVLAYVISRVSGAPVAISVPAAVFALLFSMVIGIVFGLLPSHKAANLDPIEALRHE